MEGLSIRDLYHSKQISFRFVEKFHRETRSPRYVATFSALCFPLNKGILYINGVAQNLQFRDIFLIKSGDEICFDREEGKVFTYVNVFFDGEGFPRSGYIHRNNVEQILKTLFALKEELYSHDMDFSKARYLLGLFLDQMEEEPTGGEDDEEHQILETLLQHMEERYQEKLTLETLADLCHVKPTRVSYIFHKHMKKRPIDYLIDLRMEHASKLLVDQGKKILDISHEVGYDDPYYFSRVFKKRMGVSPSEFRSHLLRSIPDLDIE